MMTKPNQKFYVVWDDFKNFSGHTITAGRYEITSVMPEIGDCEKQASKVVDTMNELFGAETHRLEIEYL